MYTADKRKLTTEICNNHQLGNFWPLPLTKKANSRGTMNTLKNSNYFDFMDLTLEEIKKEFDNCQNEKSEFREVFSQSTRYINFFEKSFSTFIERNYLNTYVNGNQIINLSDLSFDDYVVTVNKKIEDRGKMMFKNLSK